MFPFSPHLLGLVPREHLSGVDELLGDGGPHQPGQPLRAPAAGDDGQLGLGQAHPGVGGGHPHVAAQGQLKAAALRRGEDVD